MPHAYYNEIDPYCCQWLRNLIDAGHIARGDVDDRSIEDVTPGDVRGYTQCHYFAGIGVWSYALRLAGWPDDRPAWTGSCPCQPFSQAGKGAGFADERHLWPAWFHLIRECRPPVVFGEQVSAGIRHGWLDLVRADLENEGYACGHSVFGAHSVGAPHQRQRVYFVGDASRERQPERGVQLRQPEHERQAVLDQPSSVRRGEAGGMEHAARDGRIERRAEPSGRSIVGGCGARDSFWSGCEWVACRDGKVRPVEPGTFPLATGSSARVGRLRAYGNAIVPQVAAQFIQSFMRTP